MKRFRLIILIALVLIAALPTISNLFFTRQQYEERVRSALPVPVESVRYADRVLTIRYQGSVDDMAQILRAPITHSSFPLDFVQVIVLDAADEVERFVQVNIEDVQAFRTGRITVEELLR